MFWETKSYLALRILLCQILPLGQLFLPVVICESIVPSQNITIHVRFFLLSWPSLIALLQSRCHFSKYHCYVKPDWYELRWAEKSYQNLTVWKRRMYFCLKQWEGIITCAEDRKDLSSHCRRAGLQRADPPSSCAPLLLRPEASTTQHEGFLRSHHSRNVTAKQRHPKTISRQSNYTAGIKVSERVSAEGCAASVWEGSSESLAGRTLCAPLPYPQYHVALSWPGQGFAPPDPHTERQMVWGGRRCVPALKLLEGRVKTNKATAKPQHPEFLSCSRHTSGQGTREKLCLK